MIQNRLNLKKKIKNHMTHNGKKQKSEKTLLKSFKNAQKDQKKNHNTIFKLSLLNIAPAFNIIKLKNKKRRKDSIKEIPTFLSSAKNRTSWSLKYLIKTIALQKGNPTFYKRLYNEFLLGAESENNVAVLKNKLQHKTLQEKKYFRNYRW